MSAVLRAKSLRTIVCQDYRDRFRALFEDEVRVTPDLCVAVADQFPWEGVASRLLTDQLYGSFERRRDTMRRDHNARYSNQPWSDERARAARLEFHRQEARLFATLFNDKRNVSRRTALTRMARK